jgi:basic membrane protein A
MVHARRRATLAAALSLLAGAALAEPAIVYSTGGKFDASFNEAAFRGVERHEAATGADVAEFEPRTVDQMTQALKRFAAQGRDPVAAIGFLQTGAVAEAAAEHPDTRFAIVDAAVEAPNVQSVVFREAEGAYVVGVLAALASDSGVVGVVGGMDIPLIRRFACGFAQGVKATDPEAEVLFAAAGDTPAAWSDPARGAELARAQIARGADVIMQAAGGTGIGVLQAAADAGALGIGTDSDQNALHPGQVLTSMRKRTDVAVERAFSGWAPGVASLGLAEGGLDWTLNEHNAALITPEMRAAAEAAEAGIVSGEVEVIDGVEGECPVL